jgi:hypothetical protein
MVKPFEGSKGPDEAVRMERWTEEVEVKGRSSDHFAHGRLRLKRDGTSLREEAGVKGKPANGVGTQLMKRDRQITAGPALLPTTSPASG